MARRKRVRKQQKIILRYLKCPSCKNIQTIYRRNAKLKKYGHYKHLWCIYCKKRTRHVEIDMYKNYEVKIEND